MKIEVSSKYIDIVRKEGMTKLWMRHGLYCYIVRHVLGGGQLNGYVGVVQGSPLFGLPGYVTIRSSKETAITPTQAQINNISVHGGLTFAGEFKNFQIEKIWWFGFDTAHLYDIRPFSVCGMSFDSQGSYRDMKYVANEVNRLADQITLILKSPGTTLLECEQCEKYYLDGEGYSDDRLGDETESCSEKCNQSAYEFGVCAAHDMAKGD